MSDPRDLETRLLDLSNAIHGTLDHLEATADACQSMMDKACGLSIDVDRPADQSRYHRTARIDALVHKAIDLADQLKGEICREIEPLYTHVPTCPKCLNLRSDRFISINEPPDQQVRGGEVVYSRNVHLYVCWRCKSVEIDSLIWNYVGDGDYSPRGKRTRKPIIVSYEDRPFPSLPECLALANGYCPETATSEHGRDLFFIVDTDGVKHEAVSPDLDHGPWQWWLDPVVKNSFR